MNYFSKLMKIIKILFFTLIFPMFFMPSYAQETTDTLIFVQNIIRDSDGNLITSFDVAKIGYIAKSSLNAFLDEESSKNDPILTIGTQKMQIIERQIEINFDSNDVISDTTLNFLKDNGQILSLIRLVHDGIPVTNGDKQIQIWTFIRPV